MNQATQVKRNSILSFLSIFIRLVANTLMFISIARSYGPTIFGSFSSAHILSFLFVVLADFGFDLLLTTEVARYKSKASALVQKYLPVKIVFALLSVIIIWLIPVFHITSEDTTQLLYILSFSMLYTSLTNFFFALFRGLEQFQHEIKITLIINLTLLIGIVIFGFLQVHISIIALFFVITRALGLLLASLKSLRLINIRHVTFSLKGVSGEWRKILTFGFSLIFGNLYFQLITPMLAFLKGDYDVGIFESVFKLIGLALIGIDVIVNSTLPTLSRLYETDRDKWIKMSKLLNKALTIGSLPIVFVFLIFPEQIVNLVYGKGQYFDSILIMRVASIVVFVRFLTEPFALMLTTSQRQNRRMITSGIGTFITGILCLIIIPKVGALGAAIVAVIVNALVGLGYTLWNASYARKWMAEKRYLIPLLSMFMLGFCIYWVNPSPHYALPPVLLLYFVVVYFIGFDKSERELLFSYKRDKFTMHNR
jgi:O-antigen/teichoic acid export membrane protein